jgi:hypothetical protein
MWVFKSGLSSEFFRFEQYVNQVAENGNSDYKKNVDHIFSKNEMEPKKRAKQASPARISRSVIMMLLL